VQVEVARHHTKGGHTLEEAQVPCGLQAPAQITSRHITSHHVVMSCRTWPQPHTHRTPHTAHSVSNPLRGTESARGESLSILAKRYTTQYSQKGEGFVRVRHRR
jgi:hypothetical protein